MTRSVVEVLPPSEGGIRQHVAALSSILVDMGWAVTVAGPAGVLDGLPVDSRVHHSDVVVPRSMSPRAMLDAVRQLRRLPVPDLIHAHGLRAGWVAVLARPRTPVVLTMHNVVLDEVAGRRAQVERRLERMLARRVRHVIGVSPQIVAGLSGFVPADRATFIIPASPPAAPRRDRNVVRAELGAGADDVLVVVVARLHPQKDLPLFVRAWARIAAVHPHARAAIVGGGPLHDELAELIERTGVGATLRLVGASDYAVEELSAADVVAVTSTWEGVPLVVAEAVQLGRPVVTTRVGVVEDLLGAGDGGDGDGRGSGGAIVDVGDEDAFAEALSRFVGDAALRSAAGEVSRERGTVIYGATALVEQVAGIYEEVLGT